MTRDEATAFAEHWICSWNERDLDAILAHYADAVRFRSPRAAGLLGTPTIEGKGALASYWRAALDRNTSLHFALDHIVWDGEGAELLIVYVATSTIDRYAPARPSASTRWVASSRARRCTASRRRDQAMGPHGRAGDDVDCDEGRSRRNVCAHRFGAMEGNRLGQNSGNSIGGRRDTDSMIDASRADGPLPWARCGAAHMAATCSLPRPPPAERGGGRPSIHRHVRLGLPHRGRRRISTDRLKTLSPPRDGW